MSRFTLPVMLFALMSLALPLNAGAFDGSVNGVIGTKQIDDDDVDPQNLGMLGVMSDFQFGEFPIRLAADLLLAGRTKNDINISTTELGVGGRFNIPTGSDFHPFLGAGLNIASVFIEDETTGDDASDETIGGYLTAGAYYSIISRINVGAVYRYSVGEVEFAGQDQEIDAHHLGIMVGYSW